MSTALICEGVITLASASLGGPTQVSYLVDGVYQQVPMPVCSTGWQQVAYAPPFDSSQIDPLVVVAMIGAGFLLYLTPWAAAYGFSSLLKLLR